MSACHARNMRIAYACLALRVVTALTTSLNKTPLQRILEGNVCRNYYRQHDASVIGLDDDVPEDRCKIPEVQAELSHITGVAVPMVLLPAVLAAVPYLAKHRLKNKTKILLLNMLAFILANIQYAAIVYFYNVFNPRWIWINGMFSFIGGGDLVFYSLLLAIIAESIDHAILSTFYIYTTALTLAIEVGGSAGSLFLMRSSAWLPVSLSLIIQLFGIPIILICLRRLSDNDGYSKQREARLLSEDDLESSPNEEIPVDDVHTKEISIWDTLAELRATLLRHYYPLAMIALHAIGYSERVLLPFWLSSRYHWTLRGVGWVQLGISLLAAFVTSFVPQLSRYLQARHGGDGKDRDLNLARICLGFLAIGNVLLGFSWHNVSAVVSLVVIVGGTAFRDAYLGHVTSKLEKDEISQVNVMLEMASLLAFSVGSWVIGDLYSFCLTLGDTWVTSLPIWFTVIPFIFCWWLLR